MDKMRINPFHISEFGNGIILGGKHITTIYDTIPPDRMYYVSKNFTDDNDNHRYNTIQGAIDAAYLECGPITDWSYRVVILVYPGKYEEQIHSYAGYHIQGFTHEASPERKTVVLYNTGVDAAHYPLRGEDTDNYYIEGMNIQVDTGGVIGKIGSDYFTKVHFRRGDFIEATENANTYMAFKNCSFQFAGFNLTGVLATGRHTIQITDCWLSQYSWVTSSTHNDTCGFWIDNCVFNRSYPNLGGDWKMQMLNSHVFGDTKTQIDTTSDLGIIKSIISNGVHFVSAPNSLKVHECCFNDNEGYPITGADITSDVNITAVEYTQNSQQNGICGCIHHGCPIKNVGGAAINKYYSIQDAINSVATKGSVVLYDDFTNHAKLVLGTGIDVCFDGQRKFSISFTGDIIDIPDNSKCGFTKFASLNGGAITLNGTAAEVSFEDDQYVVGNLVLTKGSFAIVYKSSLFGSTGKSPIQVDNIGTTLVVGYSRIQGSTGKPALVFNAVADEKLKAKFSTFIHGDKTTSDPIATTVGQVVVSIYKCAGNANVAPAATISNDISSAGNVYDASIDF